MNERLVKFLGAFPSLPVGLLFQLDRNFSVLSRTSGPYATTGAYTFQEDDMVDSLQVSASAAAVTVNLPASPTGARRRRVIKTDSSANAVTVSAGSYTINGSATVALAAQYDFIEVEPTGSGWLIVGGSTSVLP